MKLICSCVTCRKEIPVKGIHTHIMRTHEKVGFKGSTGNNGRYDDPEYKANVAAANRKKALVKCGEIKDFTVSCFKCSKQFLVKEKEKKFPTKSKYYCSKSCANSRVVTEEHKRKTSETITGKSYIPPQQVEKKCKCGVIFVSLNTGSNYCSASCRTKYSEKQIARREKARQNRPALLNYRKDCAFKFNLADYPEEFDFTMIEQHGWYKPKNKGNNLGGVSRDHLVSIRYGFDNNLPTEHLSHPANCTLLRHGDNVSKGIKNSITYEELLERIKVWDMKYPPNMY